MTILNCPKCTTGTKCMTRIATSGALYWLILTKYSSCDCALDAIDRARLIEQAIEEEARSS